MEGFHMGNTDLVKVEDFAVVAADGKATMDIIRQNVGPHGFDLFDLDRVKIPGAGGSAWELPGLTEESVVAKSFDAIIIHFREARKYYSKSFEDSGGNTPPDCFSDDGFTGHGNPGGDCGACALAKFGTAPNGGKGMACKQVRMLFCLRAGDVIPLILTLPPTSLGACRKFFLRLGSHRVPYWGVVARIGLLAKASGSGIKYSEATFSVAAQLSAEQIAAVEKVRTSLLPALEKVEAKAEDFGKTE
jgi:hypothetical protein